MLQKSNFLNKRIILRTDYNVPQNTFNQQKNNASLETLKYIIDQKPSK